VANELKEIGSFSEKKKKRRAENSVKRWKWNKKDND